MPMVVYCCSYSLCAFSLLVLNIVVASCWLSSGDVESSVLLLLHARTHLKKKKKKNCTCSQSCCRNEEVVTYGIRAGSTRDLGFATAFVDMIIFDYSVAD
jgi:hypothetical protein